MHMPSCSVLYVCGVLLSFSLLFIIIDEVVLQLHYLYGTYALVVMSF